MVGIAVGECVGNVDGCLVGEAEGLDDGRIDKLGLRLGCKVGQSETEGFDVANLVGENVGFAEGDNVGLLVPLVGLRDGGFVAGELDGDKEGCLVGELEGSDVGLDVGAVVGEIYIQRTIH